MTAQAHRMIGRTFSAPVAPPSAHTDGRATDRTQFTDALSRLASDLRQESGDETSRLTRIVAGAIGVVPGCEHAALVVFDEHEMLFAHAVSDPETVALVDLQNELVEGPCRDTAAGNLVVRAADVASDSRWPRFAPRAVELGIRSMLCTPLIVGDRTYGSLSYGSTTPHAFDAESEFLAEIFASHAAVALADAEQITGLRRAVESRGVIGQAKGVLMERFGLDADTAFQVLTQESQRSNLKLVDVCEQLCRTRKLPGER